MDCSGRYRRGGRAAEWGVGGGGGAKIAQGGVGGAAEDGQSVVYDDI